MKIFVFKQNFIYISLTNGEYLVENDSIWPPATKRKHNQKECFCLIFCVPKLLLLSKLFRYETLITSYALLMLERNTFWQKNPINVRCYQFQRKIHIRFLAAVMDLENDHDRFAQRSKSPSLSNHQNRKDLAEKTNFVSWISGREGNFDCKL